MKEHTHVCKLAQSWSSEGGGDSERDPSCPPGEKEKKGNNFNNIQKLLQCSPNLLDLSRCGSSP